MAPDLNDVRLNFPMSNYRAVAGPTYYGEFIANKDLGGVMFQNSKIRIIDVTDGTSNTLVVGECLFDKHVEKRAAIWPGMTGVRDGSIWISDVMWWVDNDSARINARLPRHSAAGTQAEHFSYSATARFGSSARAGIYRI